MFRALVLRTSSLATIDPRGGATAPTLNHAPVLMVDLRLEAGAQVHHDIPPDFALSQRLFRNQQHVCTSCRGGISPAFKDWNRAGKDRLVSES